WQAREGYELTYLPFFVKAVLAGLRAVPELNASWAGDHLVVHRQYNLGIAGSVENGLIVPVLRDADQLSVAGVARALRGIIQKARSGKLSMDDLQGATFTVNNPGSLGSIMSQPIVPVGQSGIVTMEAIVKRPVVTADDAIGVRSMMYSCLSFDHRVLDGSGALTFLRTIKHELETVEYPLYSGLVTTTFIPRTQPLTDTAPPVLGRRPDWLKVPLSHRPHFKRLKKLMREQ